MPARMRMKYKKIKIKFKTKKSDYLNLFPTSNIFTGLSINIFLLILNRTQIIFDWLILQSDILTAKFLSNSSVVLKRIFSVKC